MWCVNDYVTFGLPILAMGVLVIVVIVGRMFWHENKCMHRVMVEYEVERILCRLRGQYKPGQNEELKEKISRVRSKMGE